MYAIQAALQKPIPYLGVGVTEVIMLLLGCSIFACALKFFFAFFLYWLYIKQKNNKC